ncbi:hypothetical protein [Lichenicoccus roseus]|nr:hypothetical protein [Lichenicoccus roseus]
MTLDKSASEHEVGAENRCATGRYSRWHVPADGFLGCTHGRMERPEIADPDRASAEPGLAASVAISPNCIRMPSASTPWIDDVVARGAVGQPAAAARIVADPAADGGTGRREDVDRKPQPMRLQLLL